MKTRQGMHKEGKSSIGIYVEDDFRALLSFVVDQSGETATSIIMEGVRSKATALGIMKDNEVLPKYRAAIEVIKEAIIAEREERKAKKGSK